MAREPSVALVDVGGTLWSEAWVVAAEELRAARVRRLRAAGVPGERVEGLERLLADRVRGADDLEYLDVWAVAGEACAASGVHGVSAEAIRHAMCLPADTIIRVLPGASVLLEAIRRRGLRCVIVSNGVWRDEVDYWDDLRAFRLASWVDAVVSSVDTRWRKPHPRFFAAALEAASAPASACLLVGNSEAKDIVPADALGMRTVRVAVEEVRPPRSRAEFVCESLEEAATVVDCL